MDILKIALKEYGNEAWPGSQTNPSVSKYFTDLGFTFIHDDETPWCAAFLNWILKQACIKGTGSLLAKSFLNIGTPTTTPELGDLVIFWRNSPTSGLGHCGIFIRDTKNFVYVLGGNQDSRVCIKAEPKQALMGYRKV